MLRSGELEAWVLPFGARLMQLWWLAAPEGPRPLSLGFEDPADYLRDTMSIGAVCGRYGNRIADARLAHEGQAWRLDANHPMGHCIHGGREGMGRQPWTVERLDATSATLALSLPDGHMGFPGNCQARVTYSLAGASLDWRAQADVDRPCPLNLLQHSYWNLDATPDLRGHRLQVDADRFLPTDARELPQAPQLVRGSCFDLRQPAPLRPECIAALDAALVLAQGQGQAATPQLRRVAKLSVADLEMTVSTDRPLLHVYASGNLRPSGRPLGVPHGPGAAVCLETEDLPNGPALGAPVWYGPGRPYVHELRLAFTRPI